MDFGIYISSNLCRSIYRMFYFVNSWLEMACAGYAFSISKGVLDVMSAGDMNNQVMNRVWDIAI